MLMVNRTIFSDNTVLKDISVALNSFQTGSAVIDFVSAQDFLFVASDFPFNHRYVDVSVVNSNSASLTIDLWDGTQWQVAQDLIDQTSVGGVPLSQSGHISWRPNDDTPGWLRDDTNDNSDVIEGLSGVNINDLYWARFKWSADLSVTTALKFLGHKFSDDNDLDIEYPILLETDVKTQFKAGKTDWEDQHFAAALKIIRDLKKRMIIRSGNQIMEWELFTEASAHKVAEIAFKGFGKDFFENRDDARKSYNEALNKSIYLIDENNNAELDVRERGSRQGFMRR